MPWTAAEAKSKTKKADTPEKQKKWAKVANAALKTYGDTPAGVAKALATAAAAMGDQFWDADVFNDDAWTRALRDRKRSIAQRDPLGNLQSTYEEENENDDSIQCEIVGDAPAPVQPMALCDAIELDDAAKVRFIDGGYMAAMPRIARTGIQIYKGSEVGRPDVDKVRVYRPEIEVFNKDTIHSYTHLPVTCEHPGEMVDAKNWSKYAKGDTGDEVLRDGNSVRVPMMLRDHDTIQAYKQDGKNQLSVGYTCDLEWKDGKTADGEAYDAIQHNIRANHLAVVAAARGGPELKLGDDLPNVPKEVLMNAVTPTNKTLIIDSITVEMNDYAAQVVQRAMTNLQAVADQFKKKAAESEEKNEESNDSLNKAQDAIKAKDAQIATLQQQLKDAEITPAKLDTLVKDRQTVIDKAKGILGKALITDARTVDDIRKQVVEAKLGSNANGWDVNQIRASFDTLTAGVKTDPIKDYNATLQRPHFATDVDPRDAAYAAYDAEMSTAWNRSEQTTKQ
jgi:uncharacterized protein